MSVYRTPAIYDNVARQIRPAGVCDLIDPAYLGFEPTTILSPAQGNMLRLKDGRLYCSGVSLDVGNYVQRGSDGAVFLDGNSLLSNGGGGKPNLISIDATDGKLVITLDILKNYGVATKPDIEAAFASIKEYVITNFISVEAFPTKLAAFAAAYATTEELDSLRVRVASLERTVNMLTDKLTTLGVTVDEGLAQVNNAVSTGLAAVRSEAATNVQTLRNEANTNLSTLRSEAAANVQALRNEAAALRTNVTEELYDVYDQFPLYTLVTTTEDLRANNALAHEAQALASSVNARGSNVVANVSKYAADDLFDKRELQMLSAEVTVRSLNAAANAISAATAVNLEG